MGHVFERNIALSWAMMGVQIQRLEESDASIIFCVSVPEFIPRESVSGSPADIGRDIISGAALIQALTYMMNVLHPVGKRVFINHSIRIGEIWTAEKRVQAQNDMLIRIRNAELFGGR